MPDGGRRNVMYPAADTAGRGDGEIIQPTLALKCPRCGARLKTHEDGITCESCAAQWPVSRGIPRFFQAQEYYWGEISRGEAAALLDEARKTSWEHAVLTRVGSPNLQRYYLDLQRCAWLAVLGLDASAVALDIGSGYGAITHSLALSLGEVYSVEAVPERIEFTQERLRQEGVGNVSLIQASAIDLPFFDNSFDLIVVNGVLEWIGEWDTDASARAAQIRFLSKASRLLKDDGVLLIGIENRFGANALRGQLDHSGMSYTSLAPRWLATQMLRRGAGSGRYAFLTPNGEKQYRTYTYSARGYRKLLREAGFEESTVYWAVPGYNRPYDLIPLDGRHPAFEEFLTLEKRHDDERGATWKSRLKVHLQRLRPLFVNEFVIVGRKRKLQPVKSGWLKSALAQATMDQRGEIIEEGKLMCAAHTLPFSNKVVLHVWRPGANPARGFAKVSLRNAHGLHGRDNVAAEFEILSRVHGLLAQHPELPIASPKPIGLWRGGNIACSVESSAVGTQFRRLLNRQRYRGNLQALRTDFSHLFAISADLTQALQSLTEVRPIDAAWYALPEEVSSDAALAEKLKRMRYFSESGCDGKESWVQHGDFVPGNIFLEEAAGRVEVIDWSDLASGYPPLYDVFTLIIQSRLAALTRKEPLGGSPEHRSFTAFSEIFLEESEVGDIFKVLIADACTRQHLDTDVVPALLIEFLLMRVHYNQARRYSTAAHARMLRAYIDAR